MTYSEGRSIGYERHWECIRFLYIILYADDTSVLLNGKRYTDLVALLNSELEKLPLAQIQ